EASRLHDVAREDTEDQRRRGRLLAAEPRALTRGPRDRRLAAVARRKDRHALDAEPLEEADRERRAEIGKRRRAVRVVDDVTNHREMRDEDVVALGDLAERLENHAR